MGKYIKKFTKWDWISVAFFVSFLVVTILPIFWELPWAQASILPIGALIASTFVSAQIVSRIHEKTLIDNVEELRSLMKVTLDQKAVQEIPPAQIGLELDELLEGTTEWYFRGGSATWQRKTVLPKLAGIKDKPVHYNVQIISPFESTLCSKYASYRAKSRDERDPIDAEQIQLELLAFIYAIAVWRSRSKIFPEITLLKRFSPFRLDGNSKRFIITVADLSQNALRTESGNWYFNSLIDEFKFESENSESLRLPQNPIYFKNNTNGLKMFLEELRKTNPEPTINWKIPSEENLRTILKLAGTNEQ